MMAGAPGASGSLVILSSSGEAGWNPTPAVAKEDPNPQNASATNTHFTKRNALIVISPWVSAPSKKDLDQPELLRAGTTTPEGPDGALRSDTNSASSEFRAPSSPESGNCPKRLSIAGRICASMTQITPEEVNSSPKTLVLSLDRERLQLPR